MQLDQLPLLPVGQSLSLSRDVTRHRNDGHHGVRAGSALRGIQECSARNPIRLNDAVDERDRGRSNSLDRPRSGCLVTTDQRYPSSTSLNLRDCSSPIS